jgi:hypothetical protein
MLQPLKRSYSGVRVGVSLSLVALATAVLVGCGQAEPPASVGKDVAAAQQRAEAKTERAADRASQDVAKEQRSVDDKVIKRDNVAAEDEYKIALARADGNHDVALQKCKALAGDAQSRCKQQADADYDAAKANSKALEVSRTR